LPEPRKSSVIGAAPAGASDPQSASNAVRDMFSSIAPRYDLLNHLLSFNIDRLWWAKTARTFSDVLSRPGARVLDLCCGTGDMAFALQRRAARHVELFGADFSHPMLQRALAKPRGKEVGWLEADALRLPFPEQSFDLVTSAFGFRNLVDYDAGLREIFRVLRPGGQTGILDFGEPSGLFGKIYRVYFRSVLPKIGSVISGVKGPYSYLPASVQRFPSPSEMLDRMRAADFADPRWIPYTFGIAGLYRANRPK
jgi:demethylmenaquinone methyltransferase/2-methoxy-6-polyprenyl-1,4-benzoquinol methylase